MWLESAIQDLRYAVRTLGKSPGFAVAAIGTLALGIGANTAIFQLIDALRLRSLPVHDPQALTAIRIPNGNGGMGLSNHSSDLTYPLWQQIREHHEPFSGVFTWASSQFHLGRGADQWHAQGLWVSGEMFPVLGVTPYRGRLFSEYDDQPGCGSPGAVISYALWQGRFGGRESAVGSKLIVNDHVLEVIGVTPRGFSGLEVGNAFDFALPICSIPALFSGDDSLSRRDFWWLTVLGRLKPGWSRSRASAYLNSASPGLFEATVPTGYSSSTLEQYRKFRLAAYPAGNGVSSLSKTDYTSLWLLMGITGLVLLIACTNIANLMLARASTREREIEIRLAIGASRSRIVRQLLSEGLLVAAAGGCAGLCVARALSGGIVWFISQGNGPIYLDLSADWRVLAFIAAAAILTCVIFGLAPALKLSRARAGGAITAGARGMTTTRERFSFQRMLVAAQIAISLVLLVSALLFVRSFRNLVTLDPGFREDGILVFFASLRGLHLPADRVKPFERQLLDEIRAVPGVASAAMCTHVPLNGSSWTLGVDVNAKKGSSKFTWISNGYFATLGVPLLAGRDFNAKDMGNSRPVLIVNQTFAREFFEGSDPIGQLVRTASEPNYPATQYEIVGVTRDTKYGGLRDEIPPQAFALLPQFPAPVNWTAAFIRSAAPLSAVATTLKKRIGELYPEMGMEVHVFQADIQNGLTTERLMAALSAFFGAVAALLASIGLYGVISYIVVRRRNEIGIRMALGASRRGVVTMIMREAALLLALGVAAGLLISFAATRAATTLLFGLKPHDPATFASAGALLALITAMASFWPARRASRLDPMHALRWE